MKREREEKNRTRRIKLGEEKLIGVWAAASRIKTSWSK